MPPCEPMEPAGAPPEGAVWLSAGPPVDCEVGAVEDESPAPVPIEPVDPWPVGGAPALGSLVDWASAEAPPRSDKAIAAVKRRFIWKISFVRLLTSPRERARRASE